MPTPEPKVEDGDEAPPPGKYFVSASQLKLYLFGCIRKWGFTYILKLRSPSGRGAALGTLVHSQLEAHLKDGKPLDFSIKDDFGTYPAEVAAPMLSHLPVPQSPGLSVERYFKFEVPECPGVIFRGFIDYSVIDAPAGGWGDTIGDHKTCGNFEYALSADDLAGDIQAMMYAKDYFLTHPSASSVRLKWGYMGTKKPFPSRPVTADITREQVDFVWPEIVRGANELVTTFGSSEEKTPARVLSLPFNADECPKYSRDGCPFRGTCNLSPKERRPFNMSNAPGTANLLTQVAARKAAITGTQPPNRGETPLQARIRRAREDAAAKAAGAPETEAAKSLPVTTPSTASMYAPGSEPPAATEATLSPALKGIPALPASDQPINCPTDYQPPPSVADAPVTIDATLAAALPAPKVKGRPKGSKNAVADALEGVDPALITRFLTSASEYYEFVLRTDSKVQS